MIEGTKYPGPFQSGIIDTFNLFLIQYDEEVVNYGKTIYPGKVEYSIISNGVITKGAAEPFEFEIYDGIYHEAILVIE